MRISETAIRMEYIAYAQRDKDEVYICFTGRNNPLRLRGQVAETFWHFIKVNSVTVLRSSRTAAQ